ncbi:MAG TPA: DUF4097 family beta strand repeat-containing protein [Bdellovibrio sp.]|nr:DUF4097 family beta strand repeat-containing protein [Bdellovibrio sp.]
MTFSAKFSIKQLVIFSSLTILVSSMAFAKSDTKEFDAQYVRALNIDNMQGDINITGVEAKKAVVVADKTKFTDDCFLLITQEGPIVKVKVEQKSFMGKDCRVNFTISMPINVKLNVTEGMGNLTILNTKGEINYKVGTGDVTIDATVLKVDGKMGSGKTTIKGLEGDAHFFAGSGAHDLTYSKLPSHGEVEIKTASGGVDLSLPADAKFSVDAKMGSGSVHNDFTATKNAKFKVLYKAGSGDLNIKKAY